VEGRRVAICRRLKGKYKKALAATGQGGQDIDLGGRFIRPRWSVYLDLGGPQSLGGYMHVHSKGLREVELY
jgi:hypothetical protein